MGSLEFDQGLDVLVIMRHLHVFVARFSYNLNQQNFVERRPDRGSKNLNTISSKSIAASLRQHGLGILSTTVNFTYQFLAQKFKVFSHFLLDEYIRGHLSKERRWFRKHKAESGNLYPHGRALGFAMDIGKLGVLESGRTFLDQFRILITEIGNALGYVRMVRSAGMHHCAEAAQFLPTSTSRHADHKTKAEEEMEPFKFYQHLAQPGGSGGAGGTGGDGVSGGGLGQSFWSEGTLAASRTLDTVAQTLGANAGGKDGATDYFKALVQVFQQVLFDDSADGNPTSEEGTSRPIHLDNFYMIIPSLCLSWIDASCQAKNFMYGKRETAPVVSGIPCTVPHLFWLAGVCACVCHGRNGDKRGRRFIVRMRCAPNPWGRGGAVHALFSWPLSRFFSRRHHRVPPRAWQVQVEPGARGLLHGRRLRSRPRLHPRHHPAAGRVRRASLVPSGALRARPRSRAAGEKTQGPAPRARGGRRQPLGREEQGRGARGPLRRGAGGLLEAAAAGRRRARRRRLWGRKRDGGGFRGGLSSRAEPRGGGRGYSNPSAEREEARGHAARE
mmetsp:Transcript_16267/g.37731  ORF Transcript_16267/g.37731 Transcript_16267/m.37731 type:complete len:557 (+) Transcript_16267:293-1963(+)